MRGSRVRAFAALVALVVLCAAPTMQTGGARDPAWSPDGRRLAFSFLDQIWIADKDGGSARPLRPDSTAVERYPAWSEATHRDRSQNADNRAVSTRNMLEKICRRSSGRSPSSA